MTKSNVCRGCPALAAEPKKCKQIAYLAEEPGEVDDKWGTAICVGTP